VRRVAGHAGYLGVGVEIQRGRRLEFTARDRHPDRVRSQRAAGYVARRMANHAHLVEIVVAALEKTAFAGAVTEKRRSARVERLMLLAVLVVAYRADDLGVSGIEHAAAEACKSGQALCHRALERIREVRQAQVGAYLQHPAIAGDEGRRRSAIGEIEQQTAVERHIAAGAAAAAIASVVTPVEGGNPGIA
jgi:hypothetical protein